MLLTGTHPPVPTSTAALQDSLAAPSSLACTRLPPPPPRPPHPRPFLPPFPCASLRPLPPSAFTDLPPFRSFPSLHTYAPFCNHRTLPCNPCANLPRLSHPYPLAHIPRPSLASLLISLTRARTHAHCRRYHSLVHAVSGGKRDQLHRAHRHVAPHVPGCRVCMCVHVCAYVCAYVCACVCVRTCVCMRVCAYSADYY